MEAKNEVLIKLRNEDLESRNMRLHIYQNEINNLAAPFYNFSHIHNLLTLVNIFNRRNVLKVKFLLF